jgi:hypothetical protein
MGWTTRSSNLGMGQNNFLFSESSRPALDSIQPHVQWALEFFVGDKVAGV